MSIKTFFQNILPVSRKAHSSALAKASAKAAAAEHKAAFHRAMAREAHTAMARANELTEHYRAVAAETEEVLKLVTSEGKANG